MQRFRSRIVAVAISALALVKAWPHMTLLWATAWVDGIALVLIWVPEKIDAWTYGTYMKGGEVSSHTPGWMIAGFGWGLLLLIIVILYWPGLLL